MCRYIVEHSPLPVRYWFIEANFSGDKKATHQSLLGVRGKRVTADVVIPAVLVVQRLHTTADRLAEYSTTMYERLRQYIRPDLVFIAKTGPQAVGFAFSLPGWRGTEIDTSDRFGMPIRGYTLYAQALFP